MELIESGQFSVDDFGHAKVFGEYILLLPVPVLIHLQTMLEKELGAKKAGAFLEEIGVYQVRQALERYKKRLGIQKVDKTKIMEFEKKIINIIGFGNVDTKVVFNGSVIDITLNNPTVAIKYAEINGKCRHPVDFYLGGILKGSFSTLTGKDMTVEEVRCAAMGDSVCRFILKPKKKRAKG